MKNLITFEALFNYINQAERNDVGEHYPFKDNHSIMYHIYENKRQLNVNINGIPVAVFLFFTDENKVALINVENGIAKYSIMYPVKVNIEDAVLNVIPFNLAFGHNGKAIMDIIVKQLYQYASGVNDQPSSDSADIDPKTALMLLHKNMETVDAIMQNYKRYDGSTLTIIGELEDRLDKLLMDSFSYINIITENPSVINDEESEVIKILRENISSELDEVIAAKDILRKFKEKQKGEK